MSDLELSVSWSDAGHPDGLRFTARGWQLHPATEGAPSIPFADLGELAHAIVARQARGEESPAPSSVSGPGIPTPRPWPGIAVVVAEVGARVPPPPHRPSAVDGSDSVPAGRVPTVVKGQPILVKEQELLAVLTAMLTRPFVLLAGVSGSGKTQLAKRLGKAWAAGWIEDGKKPDDVLAALAGTHDFISKTGTWRSVYDLEDSVDASQRAPWENQYAFTAVQSDWTDASHLWGYHVPLPEAAAGFYGTKALRVFLNAWQEKGKGGSPHFLLLDEMNLSRPEHYGSDLLSAMEVKARTGQRGEQVRGEEVIELHRAGRDLALRGSDATAGTVPQRIGWGRRLLVIGTVNVDETTFAFAPKVLDRAALLEFTDISLTDVFKDSGALAEPLMVVWKAPTVQPWFTALHTICSPHNLHLGYRAATEILEVMALRGTSDDILDAQLRNKVLPRVRGPRAAVMPILLKLLYFAANGTLGTADWVEKHLDNDVAVLENGEHVKELVGKKYPTSKAKVLEMLRRAQAVGFTSYFG